MCLEVIGKMEKIDIKRVKTEEDWQSLKIGDKFYDLDSPTRRFVHTVTDITIREGTPIVHFKVGRNGSMGGGVKPYIFENCKDYVDTIAKESFEQYKKEGNLMMLQDLSRRDLVLEEIFKEAFKLGYFKHYGENK